jgi:hypothetical protein
MPFTESTPAYPRRKGPLSGHGQTSAAGEGVSPEGLQRSEERAQHVDSPGAEATQSYDSTHKFSGRPEELGLPYGLERAAFTAADVILGFTLVADQALGVLDDRFPKTYAYLARLMQRPAFQKAASLE